MAQDPQPRFRNSSSLLEALPFGNLGKLVLNVHHPSPGPMLQQKRPTSGKQRFLVFFTLPTPSAVDSGHLPMAKSLNLAGDSKPRHPRRGMPRTLILAARGRTRSRFLAVVALMLCYFVMV